MSFESSNSDINFKKIGHTEVITDNLNPIYVNSVLVDYYFEKAQEMRISVFDIDDFKTPNVEQELIGYVEFQLHEVARVLGTSVTLPIKAYLSWRGSRRANGSSESVGNVVITGVERKRGSRSTYRFQLEGDGFKPESLFYRLSSQISPGKFVPIFESETSKRSSAHVSIHPFKEAVVHSAALIQDDESKPAMIEVFQWYDCTDRET